MGKKKTRQRATAAVSCADVPLIPPRPTRYAATPTAIRGIPTVYRCVQLLTDTARQLAVGMNIGDQTADLPEWLRKPESYGSTASLPDLVAHAVTGMAGYGAAYWYATPAGSRSWILAEVAPPRVTAQLDSHYMRTWYLDGAPVDLCNGPARRPGLLAAPFMLYPDTAEPVGPLQAARTAAAGWLDVESYASRVFRAGMHSGQTLETDQDLPADTARRYRDQFIEAHADPDNPVIPVLGGGLKLRTELVNPKDAQWLESRTFNAQEVARIFGVPARMLGLPSGDSVTYNTARDNDNEFLRYTVMPYLTKLEAAWSQLLPDGRNAGEDHRVRFDLDTLMRPTMIDRWTALNGAVQAGWLAPGEARATEHLPDMATAPPEAVDTATPTDVEDVTA